MRIDEVKTDKKRFIALLLLGDEQESMIDRYLERGRLFVMYAEGETPVCVAVVTDEGNAVCELKNIAVSPQFQRKGYGRRMIDYLCRCYGHGFSTMLVGTGNSVATVSFYRSCGFVYSHVLPGFFTRNYDHPIIEEGKLLTDMVYFRKQIGISPTGGEERRV